MTDDKRPMTPTSAQEPPSLTAETRGDRLHKMIPNGQCLKLEPPSPNENLSEELLGTCLTGVLNPGKGVTVSILDAPPDSAKTEFRTLLTTLTDATAHASTTRICGAVSLSERARVERLDGWRPLTHGHQLSETRKVQLLVQVAEAIGQIHAKGVAHGDLKPEHVFLQDDGSKVKLDRIGWSRMQTLVASTNYSTVSGTFPECFLHCTPAYAAPEVLQGELSKQDARGWMKSDIYSFTVMATEMLLGRLPWEGETLVHVWNAVTKRESRPFDVCDVRIEGKTSHALELLLRRGWHQDPAQRLSASELGKGLRMMLPFSRGIEKDI